MLIIHTQSRYKQERQLSQTDRTRLTFWFKNEIKYVMSSDTYCLDK